MINNNNNNNNNLLMARVDDDDEPTSLNSLKNPVVSAYCYPNNVPTSSSFPPNNSSNNNDDEPAALIINGDDDFSKGTLSSSSPNRRVDNNRDELPTSASVTTTGRPRCYTCVPISTSLREAANNLHANRHLETCPQDNKQPKKQLPAKSCLKSSCHLTNHHQQSPRHHHHHHPINGDGGSSSTRVLVDPSVSTSYQSLPICGSSGGNNNNNFITSNNNLSSACVTPNFSDNKKTSTTTTTTTSNLLPNLNKRNFFNKRILPNWFGYFMSSPPSSPDKRRPTDLAINTSDDSCNLINSSRDNTSETTANKPPPCRTRLPPSKQYSLPYSVTIDEQAPRSNLNSVSELAKDESSVVGSSSSATGAATGRTTIMDDGCAYIDSDATSTIRGANSVATASQAHDDMASAGDETDSLVSSPTKVTPMRHSSYTTPTQAANSSDPQHHVGWRKSVNFGTGLQQPGDSTAKQPSTEEQKQQRQQRHPSSGPRRAFSLRFGLTRRSRSPSDYNNAVHNGHHPSMLKAPPEIVVTGDSMDTAGEEASLTSSGRANLPHRHSKSPLTPSRSSSVRYHIEAFFEVSDNRLAMKLFGNRRALDKEKERQQKTARWVIHPCSKFRFYWDLVMLLLLLSNMILLPVAIAFFSEDFMQPGWLTFNCISDTFFILDIIINFRTGVIANEPGSEVILDPREIALYYLKTWFFIDFISSIPIDYIFMIVVFVDGQPMHTNTSLLHAGRAFRVMRLAKLLGLLRLLRLSRLVRYINQWQEFLNVATMVLRISNLIGLTFLLAHWNGCLQYLVPTLQGYPENSWVTKRGIQNATWFRQYTLSIFRALSHMLSIGYGQDIPDTTAEVWLTIGSMLAGATCYAIFVGHMTNLIHSYDSSRRMYTEKLKQVQEYMFYRKLPRNLRDRITDYYEHRYQGKMFDEVGIMGELSQSLREDVIGYNCRVLIQRVPFFENAEASFLSDVLTKLKPELFQPSDFIIKEGTIGKHMYFIQDGAVDIIKSNEIATTLTEGSYFGEICLLTNTKRCASVRAVTYCQLFSLQKEDFDEVLQHYPVMKRTLKGIAAQRLYKIGENPRLVSRSDELAEDLNTAHEILNEPEGMTAVTRPAHVVPEEEMNGEGPVGSVSTSASSAPMRSSGRRRPTRSLLPGLMRENSSGTTPAQGVSSHYYRQNSIASPNVPYSNNDHQAYGVDYNSRPITAKVDDVAVKMPLLQSDSASTTKV